MNLGSVQTTEGVAAVLRSDDDDDAVDPHLERIRYETGGDESDEEVNLSVSESSFVISFSSCHSRSYFGFWSDVSFIYLFSLC